MQAGTGEAILVEERCPESTEGVALDGVAVEVDSDECFGLGLNLRHGTHDRGHQRLRFELGVQSKTLPSGDSARRSHDRGFTRTVQDPCSTCFGAKVLNADWASRCYAEAGASPSSEALPVGSSVVQAVGESAQDEGSQGPSERAPGIGQSRGCSFESRLQKLVRRIFQVGTACEATRAVVHTG